MKVQIKEMKKRNRSDKTKISGVDDYAKMKGKSNFKSDLKVQN